MCKSLHLFVAISISTARRKIPRNLSLGVGKVLTAVLHTLLWGDAYVDPSAALPQQSYHPLWGRIASARKAAAQSGWANGTGFSVPTVGVCKMASEQHRAGRVRENTVEESVAVIVGAACPPRVYNNNLLWLLLRLRLLLRLLLWL